MASWNDYQRMARSPPNFPANTIFLSIPIINQFSFQKTIETGSALKSVTVSVCFGHIVPFFFRTSSNRGSTRNRNRFEIFMQPLPSTFPTIPQQKNQHSCEKLSTGPNTPFNRRLFLRVEQKSENFNKVIRKDGGQ